MPGHEEINQFHKEHSYGIEAIWTSMPCMAYAIKYSIYMLLYLPTSCSIHVSEEGKHGCKMTGKCMFILYLDALAVSGIYHQHVG